MIEPIHIPDWINLKTCAATVLIGLGLWFLFKVMGEIVKIVIALAIVGAGAFLLVKGLHLI
jgi:multisubunit Na+/H+ antiporter MnhC subunit